MRVLVTGGCGFIGSNFIHLLLERTDYEIVNLDSLAWPHTIYNHDSFRNDSRYQLFVGSIANSKIVKSALRGCDAIVNFAAQSHVDRSIEDPISFVETNVLGAVVLLQEAVNAKVSRFVQVSTDEVYGSVEKEESVEDSPMSPGNPYSASKVAAEMFVRAWANTYRYQVIVTRSGNNYGAFQLPDKAIPKFITSVLDGQPITLHGNGLQTRDWLNVRDNCEAILSVLQRGQLGTVYNVSGGHRITNLDLAHQIIKLLGRGEITHISDRSGNDISYRVSSERIHKELGWSPQISFDAGLATTVNWYTHNETWWRKVLAEL